MSLVSIAELRPGEFEGIEFEVDGELGAGKMELEGER